MAKGVRIPQQLWTGIPVLASDSFNRADAALGSTDGAGLPEEGGAGKAWQFDTGCWAISTNKAVGTPTVGVTELVTNGDMETGSPPTGWNAVTATLSASADAHTGAQSLKVARNGSDTCFSYRFISVVTGTWYTLSAWVKRIDATSSTISVLNTPNASMTSTANTWTNLLFTFRSSITSATEQLRLLATVTGLLDGVSTQFDDVSIKALTLSSLFSSVILSTADVVAEVAITMTTPGMHAGLVLNLDSAASPANFILVYHNGGSGVTVDEYVAGVLANKMALTAAAYAAGAVLRAVRYGTSLDVYYNNVKIGATLTMTANTNTMHGIFSTHSGNSFTNFVVQPRGTGNEYGYLDTFVR